MYPGYTAIPEFAQALQSWYKNRFDITLETDELDILLGTAPGRAGRGGADGDLAADEETGFLAADND